MPIGSFSTYVSGFTSDHTYQTARAVSYAKDGSVLSLSGMTWNLLNKTFAKGTEHNYSNNPFDVDEFEQNYILRKGNQLRFLWHQIKSGDFDYIVLQEVDMFTRDPLPDMVRAFLEKIRHKAWFTVHSDKTDDVRMPMLMLYNSKKLRFVSKKPLFPSSVSNRRNALEATFVYLGTETEVCITNMHLDFDTDHRQAIIEYQQQQIALGKFTILAGDANPSPGKEPYSLVGDLDTPTNISKPKEGQTASDDGGKILQRLDGFMAGPANSDARVEIIEGPSAYFKWIPANVLMKTIRRKRDPEAALGKYACRTFNPVKERAGHMVHMSLPGLPWIREKFKHLVVGQI